MQRSAVKTSSSWTIGSKEQGKRVKTFGIALIAATAVGCMVGMSSLAVAEDAAPAPAAAAPAAAAPAAAPAAAAVKFDQAAPLNMPDGSKGGGKRGEDGKYLLPDGTLTFNLAADGSTDWYTYSGYKRFHSECHVCHGPHAEGSSFAPALKDSLKVMDYTSFVTTVMSGRVRDEGGTKYVMPALGDNKNVVCFIDDLYAYIRAVAVGDLAFGRPEKHEPKPKAAQEFEDACFGPG